MPTIRAGHASSADSVHEEFLELLCADEELLRAEFDEIMAQELWSPSDTGMDPASAHAGDGPRSPRRRPHNTSGGRHPLRRHPATEAWRRQRSPPGSTASESLPATG